MKQAKTLTMLAKLTPSKIIKINKSEFWFDPKKKCYYFKTNKKLEISYNGRRLAETMLKLSESRKKL